MTPLNSEIALDFFLRLVLGHFIGDFLMQPYWLVLAKRAGWPGLVVHVGVVTFVTTLLVWGTFPYWWVWMIVLFLIHLFIDQFRTFIFTDNTKGRGLLLLLVDQLAHLISLMVIAWAATGWTPADLAALFSPDTPNHYRTMAYLTGITILISAAPVLEIENTVAVWAAQGQEMGKPLSIDREDRILGSLERIAAVTFILLGLPMLAPLMFAPRLAVLVRRGDLKTNRSALVTKMLTSVGVAMLVSLILLNVPPPIIQL
jgi:hypothetical protein